ncbi:MAG: NotI family restriction endonuclease [Pseudomonadota bacterium]
MRNPVNVDYACPFINSSCVKRSHRIEGPYPVCTIKRREDFVCVCPKRFYQAPLLQDVLENCWTSERPENPRIAYEVSMKGFGKVDFVVADIDPTAQSVRNFISVELQAVDLTGSVEPAYNAVLNSTLLEKRPSHGINWANVRKRYVSQLISKGFFHHHWKTKMVAVMQSVLYAEFRKFIQFDELVPEQGNIVFMLYDYEPDPTAPNQHLRLSLSRVVATSHNSLMMGSLYRTPPPRAEFCKKILAFLNR